jgi:hypothetical protein
MGDLPAGREGRGEELAAGSSWSDQVARLDAFEVAFRNLLATRSQVLQLSAAWEGSPVLAPLWRRLDSWLADCGRDEIVEVIHELRAVLEATESSGPQPPESRRT